MKLWRIKHKETGLYYRPVTGSYDNKSNLHKVGKFYARKPTLKHISHGYNHKGVFYFTWGRCPKTGVANPKPETIWEVEEVKS